MSYSFKSTRPALVRLSKGPEVYGPSRSAIYRLAAEKKIRLVKMGSATFIDDVSMTAHLENLPEADLKAAS